MASAPSTTIVRNNRTGAQISLLMAYPTIGYTSTSYTAPVISNLGFGGTITSGSPAFYPSGGGGTNTMAWRNASGTTVDYWSFRNTENLTDALALINAGVLAGTAYINLTTSS